MRPVKLDIDRLVGYTVVGTEQRVKKLGSAKLGCKALSPTNIDHELAASGEQTIAAA